jgi:NADH dehydrogenase/NADH:ubiquinone oxidoreductase subunit G
MKDVITLIVNGKQLDAARGETILELARRHRIVIPTLCHHDALPGQGCCRLCIVDVDEGGGPRVVVSCVYPVTRPATVFTESERIARMRKVILSMLRDRAPQGERLGALCRAYKVPDSVRFARQEGEACILCGLCVRACEAMGTGALAAMGRGVGKRIATPYDEASPDCIGCLSCAHICPTRAIAFTEEGARRAIWGKDFALVPCERCGTLFATAEEAAHARMLAGTDDKRMLCATCRRAAISEVMAKTYGI